MGLKSKKSGRMKRDDEVDECAGDRDVSMETLVQEEWETIGWRHMV